MGNPKRILIVNKERYMTESEAGALEKILRIKKGADTKIHKITEYKYMLEIKGINCKESEKLEIEQTIIQLIKQENLHIFRSSKTIKSYRIREEEREAREEIDRQLANAEA